MTKMKSGECEYKPKQECLDSKRKFLQILHEAIDSRFSDADHGFIVKATQIVFLNVGQIAQRNLKWKVLHWVAFKSFFSILCLFFLFNTACLFSDLVSSRSTEGFSSKK